MPEDKDKSQEVEKFFESLPEEDKQQADIFNEQGFKAPITEEKKEEETKAEDLPAKEPEPRKNRRHRRWEAQLEAREREIELREARAQAYAEAKSSLAPETDERLLRLYGPENTEAIKLHQELLADTRRSAKEEAIREWQEQVERSQREEAENERFIDDELENIEESYNIDITSDSPKARKARTEFLTMVSKLSPKDESGNITSYADFEEVWNIYQSTKQTKETNESAAKAKELASRSMQGSAPADTKQADDDAMRSWLRSQGIRV